MGRTQSALVYQDKYPFVRFLSAIRHVKRSRGYLPLLLLCSDSCYCNVPAFLPNTLFCLPANILYIVQLCWEVLAWNQWKSEDLLPLRARKSQRSSVRPPLRCFRNWRERRVTRWQSAVFNMRTNCLKRCPVLYMKV